MAKSIAGSVGLTIKHALNEDAVRPAMRDDAWRKDVRIEIIRMVVEIERRIPVAHIISIIVIALGALSLPNSELFIIPITFRLAAMLFSRWSWNRLRTQLAAAPQSLPSFKILRISHFVVGISWALLILPLFIDPQIHPARLAVGGTVLIGVALIVSMLSSLRSIALAFAGGFLFALGCGLAFAEQPFGMVLFLAAVGSIGGLVAYTFAARQQVLFTAQALVDNRNLEEDLSKALARAEYLATRDPLTGMLNRRAFFQFCNEHPFAEDEDRLLLTVDLDHFKRINDQFGHDTGDQVLVAAAQAIEQVTQTMPGSGHCACRLGGEEFIILALGIDRRTALSIAEALNARIRNIPAALDLPSNILISASIGVAEVRDGESLDSALGRSDLAMYRAKSRGRDRIELAA